MARNPLQQLHDHGQSVWYDNLSRELIASGGLQQLIDASGVVGVTSNPTIFEKAISGSSDYDDQIRELATAGKSTDEVYEELVVRDIQQAADILRPVFEHSDNNAGDGYVSLEVSPTLAHETQKTMEDARRLFARVDRPNVMIKIPGTPEGLPAIEQMLYEGVNVNITLLFSLEAYREVADAYLRALERRAEEGKGLEKIASVASFFVSRVDTEADKRLQKIIDDEPGSERAARANALLGKLAIANAKLAYLAFQEIFSGERWEKLAKLGAKVQRPLWASTSTKNPAYSDTLYVDELIGPHTVQTLAPASIEAFGDHGTLGETLTSDVDAAQQVFNDLESLGVSYDDITDTLVREGVASFAKSFESLLGGLDEKRQRFAEESGASRAAELGALHPKVQAALDSLRQQDVARRLRERDPDIWLADGETPNHPEQRIGWGPVVQALLLRARAGIFDNLASEVRERGYERAILLGMGGSSLGAEFIARCFPPRDGYPKLSVLDTTHPDTLARVTDEVRECKTLFIVSTKSGTTVETLSLYRHFLDERGGDASDFIAVTDAGTGLEHEANERGFWKVLSNPPETGGRYSAISYFALIPAAVAGVDVTALLERANVLLPVNDEHPGMWLGAAIGTAALEGRDYVTVVTSPSLARFTDWLVQILAESTAKHGKGVVAIKGEPVMSPDRYRTDRLFIYFRGPDAESETDAALEALRAAGHPVVTLPVDGPGQLGMEVVRWDVATTVAGGVLGVNPFDESGFQETKDVTKELLANHGHEIPAPIALHEAVERVTSSVPKGGYVAILAWADRTAEHEKALLDLRLALSAATGAPVIVSFGPRYLHATGQMHRSGRGGGTFLHITQTPSVDFEIPGARYSFGTLFAAQLAADAITLHAAGHPIARVEAGTDLPSAVRQMVEALQTTKVT
jgi:transaldolase/glucose-6-phosphate isomerase